MSEIYIDDIEKDEVRSGFLVTTDRKKIWNKEIELLLEIDRICQKYDIPYFTIDGTLLGAARHKGFIPWDDDIDVAMMRPDYIRFVQAAIQEIKSPYFLQTTYTDGRIMNWAKIMDDRTSAIENWDAYGMHQGIFVDIFPMDAVTDGTEKGALIDEMSKELWMCVITPKMVKDGLQDGAKTHVARQTLERILCMNSSKRLNVYEDFCLKHFNDSTKIAIQMLFWHGKMNAVDLDLFDSIISMPFEGIEIPVPEEFGKYLTLRYGDWQKPRHLPTLHEGIVMSTDIPYDVMMKNIDRTLLDCEEYLWW